MKHMRTIVVLVVLVAVAVSLSMAQLKYIERFPFPDTTTAKPWGTTKLPFGVLNGGLGVDPDGKVWFQPYGSTGVDSISTGSAYIATRPVYVFNPDGTPASFSPITVVTGPNESNVTVTDTIHSRLGYGGNIDPSSGNFIGAWGNWAGKPGLLLWEIDYKTGAGVRRTLGPTGLGTNSPASVAVNDAGEIFVAGVVGALPGLVLNPDMTVATQFAASIPEFGRTIAVSGDGNDVYAPRFTAKKTYVYHSANGSLGPYALTDSILQNMSTEAIAIHPTTGHIWASADSRSGRDTADFNYTWSLNRFYAYDPVGGTLVDSFSVATTSHGDTLWKAPCYPRGIAFSPGGDTVYVAHFDVPALPAVVRFIKLDPTSVTRKDGVPNGFELMQNYPNPFNPTTEIRFSITEGGKTTLIVYDMLGRAVRGLVNGNLSPGTYTATFNASDLSTGMYIYVLTSGDARLTKKMVLTK